MANKAKKQRRHLLVVSLTFDVPVDVTHAISQASDIINGNFYPEGDSEASSIYMKIIAGRSRKYNAEYRSDEVW